MFYFLELKKRKLWTEALGVYFSVALPFKFIFFIYNKKRLSSLQ